MAEPGRLQWRLEIHDELPSTSDLVRSRAEAGEPAGLAVLARRQTKGRGSRGRAWSTPDGNLAISMLLRPDLPMREAGGMSLLSGLALAEAVAAILPPGPRLTLKWPNDLLLEGNKLAGILLESQADGQGRVAWVIPGIGVNLAPRPHPARPRRRLPRRPHARPPPPKRSAASCSTASPTGARSWQATASPLSLPPGSPTPSRRAAR